MSRDDWFRNTTWSPQVESAFAKKLARARDKPQYLRIQASTLASTQPGVALRLLDQYFKLGRHFDFAQAHVDRATALLALGDIDAAISACECALAREAEFPNALTRAYLMLPLIIAMNRKRSRYQQALNLLEEHKHRLTFPVDRFIWNGTRAVILSDLGQLSDARSAARTALATSRERHSGFPFHPRVGLVGGAEEALRLHLVELVSSMN